MKRLLGVLGAVGLTATTGATIVSCSSCKKDDKAAHGIIVDKASVTLRVSEAATITISNAKDLTDIAAKGVKADIATVEVKKNGDNFTGDVEIKGVAEGNFEFHIEAKKNGKAVSSKTIKVEVKKKDSEPENKKKLSEITISAIKIEVENNTKVTGPEAEAAKDSIKDHIQQALVGAVPEIAINTDYTIDDSEIKAGDLSNGAKVKVKANESSKKVDGEVEVNVTFTNKEVSQK